jgi:hypothetical protein
MLFGDRDAEYRTHKGKPTLNICFRQKLSRHSLHCNPQPQAKPHLFPSLPFLYLPGGTASTLAGVNLTANSSVKVLKNDIAYATLQEERWPVLLSILCFQNPYWIFFNVFFLFFTFPSDQNNIPPYSGVNLKIQGQIWVQNSLLMSWAHYNKLNSLVAHNWLILLSTFLKGRCCWPIKETILAFPHT